MLQLPMVSLKKSSISDMQHCKTYNYFNFQQNWVSRSVKTVHTNVFAKIISCIDLQIPIEFSKKSIISDKHRSYETLVKTSRVILYITQDAREAMRVVFFCTYKTYLYAQN